MSGREGDVSPSAGAQDKNEQNINGPIRLSEEEVRNLSQEHISSVQYNKDNGARRLKYRTCQFSFAVRTEEVHKCVTLNLEMSSLKLLEGGEEREGNREYVGRS
jgi:hypothetical protein